MYDRDQILRDLKFVLSQLPKLPLPVRVTKILVFGSFLRKHEVINDCDLVVVFHFNEEARKRWSEFLSILGSEDVAGRININGFSKNLEEHLRSIGIDSAWFGKVPLQMIRDRDFRGALFRVVKNMMFGNNQEFHVYLCEETQFERGDIPGIGDLPLNCVFLWSPDRSDVEYNLDQFDEKEQLGFFQKELDYLLRDISKLEKDLRESSAPIPLKRSGGETIAESITKCESARNRIRDLRRKAKISS